MVVVTILVHLRVVLGRVVVSLAMNLQPTEQHALTSMNVRATEERETVATLALIHLGLEYAAALLAIY